ncbi:putative kinase-like protein TMKL1, partial [Tanacetum coccineum]
MGVLTVIIQPNVHDSDDFTFHHNYSYLNIMNLCFADGLSLFAHGDVRSARVIMDSLNECKTISDLVPSAFPVKYLGVPLISTRLVYRDCQELDRDGVIRPFSAGLIWDTIKARDGEVPWAKVVWFSHCIPHHAFYPLLVVKLRARMIDVSHVLEDILDWLIPKYKLRSRKRTKDQVEDIIVATVRLTVLSFRFKKSKNVVVLLEKWNLPTKKSLSTRNESSCDKEANIEFKENVVEELEIKGDFLRFQGGEDLTCFDILDAPGEVIGKSSYGTLYRANLLSDPVLLLRFLRPACCTGKVQDVMQVVQLLGSIRHPNLVSLCGFYSGPRGEKLLVHPFYRRGNLAQFVR